MKRDDFYPDEHEPAEVKDIEITLTVEMYEFDSEEYDGLVGSRFFVVRNSLSKHYTVGIDAQTAVLNWGNNVYTQLKRELEEMWKQ